MLECNCFGYRVLTCNSFEGIEHTNDFKNLFLNSHYSPYLKMVNWIENCPRGMTQSQKFGPMQKRFSRDLNALGKDMTAKWTRMRKL